MSGKPFAPREPTLNELNATDHRTNSPIVFDFSRPAPDSEALPRASTTETASEARHAVPLIQNAPSFDEYLETFRQQNLRTADNWWTYSTSLQGNFFPFRIEGLPERLSRMHAGRNVYIRLPSSRYTNAARYEPGTVHRCSADFAEVAVREELIGATIRQLRNRKTQHCLPFEISLEADVADAPIPTASPLQPQLRQYTCSCCDLSFSDVTEISVFEKSLILRSPDNQLHLVDLSEPAYWGLLNALFHRLPKASAQRTIRFVSPKLKRTTLDQLAFYLSRIPNVTTFVYPRITVDEFTLEACRQQLEAHQYTLRSVVNVTKWPHLPTSLTAKGKSFVTAEDTDPVTQCAWPYQRIALSSCTPDDTITFEIRSSRLLGLLYEVRGTSARFLARKVTIRVQRHFATDDLEALVDALSEVESVFAFAEEFHLFVTHTPPAIASMHEAEGFAITIAQQLLALEFALRIWLSSAPLQRRWNAEVQADLRAHRAIKSSDYPVIVQKVGRSLQTTFAIRRLRQGPTGASSTEIRSTVRHLHMRRTCVVSAVLSPEPGPEITTTLPPNTTWQERFQKALAFTIS